MRKIRIKAATDGTGIRALVLGILEAGLNGGDANDNWSLPSGSASEVKRERSNAIPGGGLRPSIRNGQEDEMVDSMGDRKQDKVENPSGIGRNGHLQGVSASTKTRKAKVPASDVKASEFSGQGDGEPSSEPRTVGERTGTAPVEASKQTSTPAELSPEVRMKPPEGSSWSRIGWITMVDKLRREPTEAEWELYQRNRL